MRVKKIRRMCTMKGCSRTDTYAITKTSEFGGVILCEDCLRSAIKAIENGGKFEPDTKPKTNVPLFHHPDIVNAQKQAEPENDNEFTCPTCGKVCKNKSGLNAHMRSHEDEGAENG